VCIAKSCAQGKPASLRDSLPPEAYPTAAAQAQYRREDLDLAGTCLNVILLSRLKIG